MANMNYPNKIAVLRSVVLCLVLFLNWQFVHSQAPSITTFQRNDTILRPYEKFEATFELNRTVAQYGLYNRFDDLATGDYIFPHDSTEINAFAMVTSPTGKKYRVYVFYNEQYYISSESCRDWIPIREIGDLSNLDTPTFASDAKSLYRREVVSPSPWGPRKSNWKFRFTPDSTPGTWLVQLLVTDKYSVVGGVRQWTTYNTSFEVFGKPVDDGFIRIKEGRHRYLYREYTGNMEYMIPAPDVVRSVDQEYTCTFMTLAEELEKNGINMVRAWIDGSIAWGWYTPLKLIGYDKNTGAMYTRIYNLINAARLDTLLSVFHDHHVNIQLCLFAPALGTEDDGQSNNNYPMYTYCKAYRYPFNHRNIGEFRNPFDFYRRVNRMQHNLIRYAASRWGYATNLMAWEIGNELALSDSFLNLNESGVYRRYQYTRPAYHDDTVVRWFRQIYGLVKYYDPHKHIVNTSIRRVDKNFSDYSRFKEVDQNSPGFPPSQRDHYYIDGGSARIRDTMDMDVPHHYDICPMCPDTIFNKNEKLSAGDKLILKYNLKHGKVEDLLFNQLVGKNILNSDDYSKLYKKPIMIQEWGYDGGCGEELNDPNDLRDSGLRIWDPYGFQHHNTNWMMLFSHSAGLPYSFNGPGYGDKLHLWKGPAKFIKPFKDISDNAIPSLNYIDDYRVAVLSTGQESIMGWAQDTHFIYSTALRKQLGYVRSLNPEFRHSTTIKERKLIFSNLALRGVYRCEYFNTVTGDIAWIDTLLTDFNTTYNKYLALPFPSDYNNSVYGDFAFKLQLSESPRMYFRLNGRTTSSRIAPLVLNPTDTMNIVLASGGYGLMDSIVITETDSLGQDIIGRRLVLYKSLSASDTSRWTFVNYWSDHLDHFELWHRGLTSPDSWPPFRTFKFTLLTDNQFRDDIQATIWVRINLGSPEAKLNLRRKPSGSDSSTLHVYFGEPIYFAPGYLNGRSNSWKYFIEEIDSTGSASPYFDFTNSTQHVKPTPIEVKGFLGQPGITGEIHGLLLGYKHRTRKYRVVLESALSAYEYSYTGNSKVDRDTCYVFVKNCNSRPVLSINNDTFKYDLNSPYFYDRRDESFLVFQPNGATTVNYRFQRIDTTGAAVGVSFGYNSNFPQYNDSLSLKAAIGEFLDYNRQLGDTVWMNGPYLIRLDTRFSNVGFGGCDSTDTLTRIFKLNTCYSHFQPIVAGPGQWHDGVFELEQPGTWQLDLSGSKGLWLTSISMFKETNTGKVLIGKKFLNNYSNTDLIDLNFTGQGLDSSLSYPLKYNDHYIFYDTGNNNDLVFRLYSANNCLDSFDFRVRAFKQLPASVKLNDTAWPAGFKMELCDTTELVLLKFVNPEQISRVYLKLSEMESCLDSSDCYRIYRRYDGTKKRHFLLVPEYGYYENTWNWQVKDLASLKNGINLDELSLHLRRRSLERDKVWLVHGSVNSLFGAQPIDLMFDFSRSCSSPPPFVQQEIVKDQRDSQLVKLYSSVENCFLYPIPVDDGFEVNCAGGVSQYFIHDASGRCCMSGTPSPDGHISCPSLKIGLYLVTLQKNDGRFETIKILKR